VGDGLVEPVRARRLTQEEGRKLQQLVRRGKHDSVRMRWALIIMASASGTPVPAIANLIAGHEDTVRDVIHAFNEIGLRALDPRWAGGRPRRISDDDEAFSYASSTVSKIPFRAVSKTLCVAVPATSALPCSST
jgi:hypothetical protein